MSIISGLGDTLFFLDNVNFSVISFLDFTLVSDSIVIVIIIYVKQLSFFFWKL